MKKVECPSCGGTGVIRHGRWSCGTLVHHQCHRCSGFGFILIDPAVFSKFKKLKTSRYASTGGLCMSGHWWYRNPNPEYREFTGLSKVRNIHHVLVGQIEVPYSTFYKQRRNHR